LKAPRPFHCTLFAEGSFFFLGQSAVPARSVKRKSSSPLSDSFLVERKLTDERRKKFLMNWNHFPPRSVGWNGGGKVGREFRLVSGSRNSVKQKLERFPAYCDGFHTKP